MVFGSLLGTKYERKCPDLMIDGELYEYEGFEKPWNRRKIKNMLAHGFLQASRIIIDNTKGASDRIIRKAIMARLKIGTDKEKPRYWLKLSFNCLPKPNVS